MMAMAERGMDHENLIKPFNELAARAAIADIMLNRFALSPHPQARDRVGRCIISHSGRRPTDLRSAAEGVISTSRLVSVRVMVG